MKPPRGWFADPKLDRLTPLTVMETGRVVGHFAGWDTCHTAYPDECVTAPRSPSGYAYFMLGEVTCSDDTTVPVGQLTMHTGHAPLAFNQERTRAHYDNTSVVVADVAIGEDDHGPWLAGALRPTVSDEDRRALSAAKLSGDWRRVEGHLELLAILAVNVPGFPVPRARVASGEPSRVLSLVASGLEVRREVSDADFAHRVEMLHRLADRRSASSRP